ncbi:MAG: class I SAM-dependent methyltransferase [Myxococcaceae bacterium]|nr:class I SAM-dependent methyltransferase [Myxococcaceae bacterium]
MTAAYIHGSTDDREVARLDKQARWCAPWVLARFDAAPGMRVLDLATGVGSMATELLARWPGIVLSGVDLSATQLAKARRHHAALPLVRANGTTLPFPDDTFDRVHGSWFLEHVPADVAVQALREVRRTLKPGGYAHFTEVDNSTFRTEPRLPKVHAALDELNAGQQRAGGDPFIGPKLAGYLAAAGFGRIDARENPMTGDANDLVFFRGFIDEFAEIFEGLDEALGAPLTAAATELRGLIDLPGARIEYRSTIAQAHK